MTSPSLPKVDLIYRLTTFDCFLTLELIKINLNMKCTCDSDQYQRIPNLIAFRKTVLAMDVFVNSLSLKCERLTVAKQHEKQLAAVNRTLATLANC